jgi:hypothetical protein
VRRRLVTAALVGAVLSAALLVAGDPDRLAALAGPVAPVAVGPAPEHVLHTLPDWVRFGGITLGRHVFLKRAQQTELGLGHELVHVRQQAAHPIWFWVSYALFPRWRLRWEAEAWAVHARGRCAIDGDHGLAAYLSGPAYLWMASRDRAAAAIRRFQ